MSATDIARSEAAVQRTTGAVKGYLNPFSMADKTHLYVISSGSPVSQEIERDVMWAEQAGHAQKVKFINERLLKTSEPTHDFYDRLTKLKLLKKSKLSSSQGKLIQYQEQGNIAFQLLVKAQILEQV